MGWLLVLLECRSALVTQVLFWRMIWLDWLIIINCLKIPIVYI